MVAQEVDMTKVDPFELPPMSDVSSEEEAASEYDKGYAAGFAAGYAEAKEASNDQDARQ